MSSSRPVGFFPYLIPNPVMTSALNPVEASEGKFQPLTLNSALEKYGIWFKNFGALYPHFAQSRTQAWSCWTAKTTLEEALKVEQAKTKALQATMADLKQKNRELDQVNRYQVPDEFGFYLSLYKN